MSKNIHLAIYDKKNAGIASAAIHLQADKVILLHRKEHDIEGIKSVLNFRGIKCEGQMVSFDPSQIRTILKHIFARNSENKLTFNSSSGYRMMVLVSLEKFASKDLEAFVVDKFTNKLHWLNPVDRAVETVNCELRTSEYLKLFSAQVLSKGQTKADPKAMQELTQWLINNIDRFGSSLAALNHIAMRSEHSLRFRIDSKYRMKKHLKEILQRFSEVGILSQDQDNVYFKDEDSRFYANGGWLENHVFNTLHSMQENRVNISDLCRGLEVVRAKGVVKNEIDVVTMVNNRLHVIECKTRKFTKHNHANTPGAAAIYRLDTLKEMLGGNSGKGMLISYQKLSRYTEQRAYDFEIFCCSHEQLKNLQDHLYKFIDSEK